MDPNLALVGVGALTALGTAVGAWFGRRRRSTADTHSEAHAVATDVGELVAIAVRPYQDQVARLSQEVADLKAAGVLRDQREQDLKKTLAKLEIEVAVLRQWVRAQGVDPEDIVVGGSGHDPWLPPDRQE